MFEVCILLFFLTYGETAFSSMTNSWAVEVEYGGKEAADALSSKYGFINLGQVGSLKNIYHFVMPDLERTKRNIGEYQASYHITGQLEAEENVGYVKQQERRTMSKKEGYVPPSDPNWNDQWSLLNTGQLNPSDVGRDLNVERAWLQGVTGCGSIIAIVDDGVEYTHSDLDDNYLRSLQYDFLDRDNNAFPATVDDVRESHGTNCAGEIAMKKGNDVCGVGVAYNSQITGLRLVSDPGSTDIDDAEALSWKNDVIHIYSNSWGPPDDGLAVAGPGDLLAMALKNSVVEGRGGKGNIYTFAAGNGGSLDTCAADGFTNSIYTIAVGSAGSDGNQSSFDEKCSGKLVVTFDSDPYLDTRHVTTTNVENSCITGFVGTSASTPLASGVIALLLEANPNLTWRDVQYLLVYTSNTARLAESVDWVTNGGNLRVSNAFGFGAIDAEALVSRGRHWTNVPMQLSRSATPPTSTNPLTNQGPLTLMVMAPSDIVFLEHVVVVFSLSFVDISLELFEMYATALENGDPVTWPERGQIQVTLTSPSGTNSTILPTRFNDALPDNYTSWPLMSVHFWGENPVGLWTIVVTNLNSAGSVRVEVPSITFYGTSQIPQAVSQIPTQCSSECDATRGCAASGAEFCDACAMFRIASSLECVSSCPGGMTERRGYCYNATLPEAICTMRTNSAETVSVIQFGVLVMVIYNSICLYWAY